MRRLCAQYTIRASPAVVNPYVVLRKGMSIWHCGVGGWHATVYSIRPCTARLSLYCININNGVQGCALYREAVYYQQRCTALGPVRQGCHSSTQQRKCARYDCATSDFFAEHLLLCSNVHLCPSSTKNKPMLIARMRDSFKDEIISTQRKMYPPTHRLSAKTAEQ